MFATPIFWVFVAVILVIYSLLKTPQWQNLLLLGASYVIYAYFSAEFVLLLILLTWFSHGIGRRLASNNRFRRPMLVLGVVANIVALVALKYVVPNLIGGSPSDTLTANILLPLGISFYIFRILSYLFDVYAGRLEPVSGIDFALYVSFFSQISSGPIERAATFLPRLKTRRVVTQEQIILGLTYIFIGIFYKTAIADPLAASTTANFAHIGDLSSADALALLILFSVRLYADFAGYSAIAIGISTWFVLPAMENFRQPYFSKSIVEFWTRWHISLSSWMRDYVFFPLSRTLIKRYGSKYSFLIQNSTMFLMMVLIGLWHGMSLPFLAWGALHGVYMIVERLLKRRTPTVPPEGLTWLANVLTIQFLVAVGWIFFGVATLADASLFFTKLFSFNYDLNGLWWPRVLTPVVLLLLVDIVKSNDIRTFWTWNLTVRVAIVVTMVVAILIMGTTTFAPFIYQNF